MPINLPNKVIFVHIPKTGGSSIEKMFNIKQLISTKKTCPSLQHMTGDMIRKKIGRKAWKRCFRFTIVRHPYTRMLSEYNWGGSAIVKNDFMKFMKRVRYIVKANRCHAKFKFDHFLPQHKYTDGVRMHYIGKFEEYENVVQHIENKMGKKVRRLHFQRGKRKSKKTFLTQEEKDIIYEVYEKDFETFNYKR